MGMFGDVFGSPEAGEILKAVANPITTAGGAVGGLLKQSGILDEVGKLLDGAVKKPKGGISGLAEQVKKMVEGMAPLPTGLMDTPGYGGKTMSPGYGGKGMPPSYGSKGMPPSYGGKGGGAGYGAKGMPPGYGGKMGGPGYGGSGGGYGGGMAGGMGGLATMAQKAIFIATLQKIIQDVASKPNFNMDRAINDVWMQVSMLRAQKAMSDMNEAFGMMEHALKTQHEMSKAIIGNIR